MTEKNKISFGKLILTFLYVLIFPALILILSGNWRWIEGWIFAVWYMALCFATIIHLYRKDPELLAERYRKPGTGNQKQWDFYVMYSIAALFILWTVMIPLDAQRYRWSGTFPIVVRIIGAVLLLISFFFFYRSYAENSFASAMVRIQKERKQQVISTGVYGIVRHPMYFGGVLLFWGGPLLMGSFWGIGIGAVLSFVLAGRITGEEKMLLQELEGYEEYRRKVKYRLIPLIW